MCYPHKDLNQSEIHHNPLHFHIFLENGQPKLGVRFVGEEVEEIQGEKISVNEIREISIRPGTIFVPGLKFCNYF